MRKVRDILWYEAQEAVYDCECGAGGRPLPGAIEDEPTDAQIARREHLEERAEREVEARGDTRAVLPPVRQLRSAKKAEPIAASPARGTNPPTLPANDTSEEDDTPAADIPCISKAAE